MKIKKVILSGCALIIVAALVGCGKGQAPEPEVVARVGDAVLTLDELNRLDEDQHRVKMPTYLTKEELMEEWIRSEVLYQNAVEEGVPEEKECAWRIRNSAKGIVIQRYWELNVYEKKAEVSDEEALAWYEDNKEKSYRAKETGVWLRRILLNSEGAAADVLARIGKGEDFAAVALDVSVTPEKLKGGDLGYRRLGDVSPTYRDAVGKMKEGEVAGPFRLGQFYAVLKLEDRVDAGDYLKPEGIGMESLRDKAKVEMWREKAARIAADLGAAADVERHPERIPEPAVDMALGEDLKPGTAEKGE
ncbi:MAG: peptidylprolyl isomerase [Candidatus Zixiibacteriota bacterium]|jgi:parvulin-like peptidyl-prolyl isomerase